MPTPGRLPKVYALGVNARKCCSNPCDKVTITRTDIEECRAVHKARPELREHQSFARGTQRALVSDRAPLCRPEAIIVVGIAALGIVTHI